MSADDLDDDLDWLATKGEGTDDDALIAFHVARLRKRRGMSQARLAEEMAARGLTHWHQNTVSRVERGTQELSLREVVALGEVLGDVLAGTGLAQAMRDLGRAGVRAVTLRRLAAVEETLTTALDDVRKLREAWERASDGKRQETS